MEKKYQIFISSTYKDLIEARSKVRDTAQYRLMYISPAPLKTSF